MEDVVKKIIITLFALLIFAAPAGAKETLTIYTYDSFVTEWGPGGKIKEAFEKTCDCAIEWVAPGDGVAVLNRLKLEGKNTKADVVLGLDTNLTSEAVATGLFGKHGIDHALAKTPVLWTDDYFMPFDFAHFAVIYDSEAVKQPPASLDELVNGDPQQKIVLQDPRSSTPGLGFLLWMKSVYGDKADEAWAKLKPRILTTAPGWSEAYALFTKGEAPMVLSYTTSPAVHVVLDNIDRYKAAPFAEGHYLQVEVAGLIDASPERALAGKFLQFMMEPGFQDHIPTNNWMWPAGTTSAPPPAAFDALVKPSKTLLYTPEEVAKNRRAWIDEWLNAMAK
ncbi:MAG: thiamine ABC transporter substrate binding subunit [Rhizobiales bacterium]|nr:thiamine ABC transporter substrate binding subunit [Hyphomicrobiales bacterium]